jgi:hypothetical protein
MAKEKDDNRVDLTCITKVGIACMVHVWEPHVFKNSKNKDPAYRMMLVFPEGMEALGDVKRIVGNAAKAKWGEEKTKDMLKKKKLSLPWRPASDYDEYGEPFTRDGAVMISVSTRNPPQIVDARRREIANQQDFYSGCLARCSVYAHAFDSDGNAGVTLLLNNVQKAGDGTKLSGGRKDASEEFTALEEEDDSSEDLGL